jgi:hypothetical protein
MELAQILDSMEPAEALAALKPQLRKILSSLDEETVVEFVTGLMEQKDGDKLSSMVHL